MRLDPETGKLVPAVSGEELVGMLRWPEAPPLELDEFARVPSFDVHGDLALALAERVAEQCARDDVAGVVVTHGTDTMEESVYTVDRLHDSEKPVAFTGAQRGADEPDTDGPRNLRNAIQVALAATSPPVAGRWSSSPERCTGPARCARCTRARSRPSARRATGRSAT